MRPLAAESAASSATFGRFLSFVLLTSGCGDLLSLHPLYTEQDRVFDAALEGRWEDNDNPLTVEREGAAYQDSTHPRQRASRFAL
jgi:hypothetical protein